MPPPSKRPRYGKSMITARLLGPSSAGAPSHLSLPRSCAIFSVVNWMVAHAHVEGIQVGFAKKCASTVQRGIGASHSVSRFSRQCAWKLCHNSWKMRSIVQLHSELTFPMLSFEPCWHIQNRPTCIRRPSIRWCSWGDLSVAKRV